MKHPDGITVHPKYDGDIMLAKKCSNCGDTMVGGFHEDVNKYAFGCPNPNCRWEGWLDADGRQVEDGT